MLIKLTKFFFGSVVAQGLGAVAGLLLARWMTIEDYAIFTVMMVITGAMSVLTKGGVNLGFSAIVGRTWPNRTRATQALNAAMKERRIISLWVLPPLLLVAGWLLLRNHATPELIAGLLVLLLLQWEFDMRTRVVDQILMFANRAAITQALDAVLALLRVLGVLGLYFYALLQPLGVVALGVVGAGLRIPFIGRWIRQELPKKNIISSIEDRAEIRRITRRQLPLEVFFVLQSQIVLAILAWYAATDQTASIGALGRIGQLLLPIQAVVQAFGIPRFSSAKQHIFRDWLLWSAVGGLPGFGLVVIAYFSPAMLLFLIGPHYANLHYELLIGTLGMAAAAAVANAWKLLAHRGWNHRAWLQVPVVLIWCVTAPLFLDLTKLDQVLWFQAGFPLGLCVVIFFELIAAHYRGDLSNMAIANLPKER
ncbi:hypothetical protein [Methylobacter psychrophilus]|uniref:hypothetical protein n=1 Tax=Methylobacter psychrophilus TaxID=96941 RepID=UPI0021D4957E|nr:hypothetical protein [Methylobacter psychrophilus]